MKRNTKRTKTYRTKVKQKHCVMNKSCEASVSVLRKEVRTLTTILEIAEDAANDDRCTDQVSHAISSKRDGKTYEVPVRKCNYNAVACNVPVEQVGPVILYTVKEMTGQSIASMPDVSTVCQMVCEMGIISDLQAGTVLLSGTNHNLAFDATGIDGSHINEVHVNTDSHGSVVLQIAELAGGQSTDYVEHITDALSYIAHTYATFHNKEPDSTEINP